MADLPILFSAPMVRGLIREVEQPGTGKTQTRRILKLGTMLDPMPNVWEAKEIDGVWHFVSDHPDCSGRQKVPVRFRKGDRLYVREHWRTESKAYDDLPPSEMDADYPVIFEADADWSTNRTIGRFRQGMHMPRWASRLALTVTDVRVQRLQECSEADAVAEGIAKHGRYYGLPDADWDDAELSAVAAYRRLWGQINGVNSWDANPWIVALTFTVERRNIDA